MFQGLRTVIYHVSELERAKTWYTTLLGTPPYFDEPYYVGFNVAGYELGLQPLEGPTGDENTMGVVTYWGVEDIDAVFARLIELGATAHDPVTDVGGGIKVADVVDPFGNPFGIIFNPHFKLG
jgi:predicted enzyme related to lactoylglutathione lyase